MSEPQFLSGIKVVYGDQQSDEPTDRIRELNGKSDNINDGFGGKFVWLVPEYAPVVDLAVTGFDIVIQKDPANPPQDDLAKGAGGDYRYLILAKSIRESEKVTKIYLLRLDGTVGDSPQSDWKYSSDINKGRGPPALYLIWKTSATPNA